MATRVKATGFISDVDVLAASEADALDIQQSQAIDGSFGGVYTPTADIDITDGSGGGLGDIDVHGQLHFKGGANPRETLKAGSLPVTDNQDIGIASGGQILRFASHAAQPAKNHDMDNTGAAAGDWLRIIRASDGGGNPITIHKDGSGYAGAAIVTLTSGQHDTCMLYFDGTDWRLGMYSNGCTPGADA